MKRIALCVLLAGVALAGCGATLQTTTWDVKGTMDTGDNCISTDDVDTWTGGPRTLIVQAKRPTATTWTEILRMVATTGLMSPALTVPASGDWRVRAMVADSLGYGCWSDEITRNARGWPSKVRAL